MYKHLFQGAQRLSLNIFQVLAPNPCRQGCASCGTTWQREDLWVPAACCAKAPVCKAGLTILHGARSCANTVSSPLFCQPSSGCARCSSHGRKACPQLATCAGAHMAAIHVLQGASLPQLGVRQQSWVMQVCGKRRGVYAWHRELAQQVADSCSCLRKLYKLRVACVVGGSDRAAQLQSLAGKPDIIVATPGRLTDLADSASSALRESPACPATSCLSSRSAYPSHAQCTSQMFTHACRTHMQHYP